jgi:hypothetical protein
MTDEAKAKPKAITGTGQPPFGEGDSVPFIFVDGAQGSLLANDTMRINLYQVQQVIEPEEGNHSVKRVFVARLAMSPNVALSIAEWLSEQVQAISSASVSDTSKSDGTPD